MPRSRRPGPGMVRLTAMGVVAAGAVAAASCRRERGEAAAQVTSSAAAHSPIMSAATGDSETPGDWPRFGWNASRSSAPTVPMGITAGNIGSLVLQQVKIDGTVDASAIYLRGASVNGAEHDVFFVTTTYGRTLAIDADRGNVLWEYTPASYDGLKGSAQITTATPVADPDGRFIYAATPDGNVQKLGIEDGGVVWRTSITRLPQREKIASALNFDRGHVVAVTGGYIGDAPPYQGHVAILDATTGALLHVWNSLCSDRHELIDPASCRNSDSAIWGRAGAVIDPATGSILVATGNGHWDGRTDWGDAVIALDSDATTVVGNYTPSNTAELDERDADLGSTSPVLLGDGLLAQGGKDGRIRLLDRSRMSGASPHMGGERQVVATPSGTELFTAPAVMHRDSSTRVFVADGGGTAAWEVRNRTLVAIWHNSFAGTSPVVVDDLLFVYDPGGSLRIYQAVTGRLVAALPCGGGHWNSPIVADRRIVLPEGNANAHAVSGVLDIWRLR